ncbi:UNVERIFIED_CONTAM: hypothetical protein NCL1_21361 [Trichonephila clavipes]
MGISASTEHLLPGLEAVGFFCQIDGDLAVNELLGICEQRFGTLQLELENPVVLFVWKEKENNEVNITAKLYSSYYGTLADLSVSNIDQNSSVLIRARGQVPMIIELASDLETLKENVELAVEKLRSIFQSRVVAFILQNSHLMIHSFKETSDLSMKELLKIVAETESNETVKAKKTMKKKGRLPVNFEQSSSAVLNLFSLLGHIHIIDILLRPQQKDNGGRGKVNTVRPKQHWTNQN